MSGLKFCSLCRCWLKANISRGKKFVVCASFNLLAIALITCSATQSLSGRSKRPGVKTFSYCSIAVVSAAMAVPSCSHLEGAEWGLEFTEEEGNQQNGFF